MLQRKSQFQIHKTGLDKLCEFTAKPHDKTCASRCMFQLLEECAPHFGIHAAQGSGQPVRGLAVRRREDIPVVVEVPGLRRRELHDAAPHDVAAAEGHSARCRRGSPMSVQRRPQTCARPPLSLTTCPCWVCAPGGAPWRLPRRPPLCEPCLETTPQQPCRKCRLRAQGRWAACPTLGAHTRTVCATVCCGWLGDIDGEAPTARHNCATHTMTSSFAAAHGVSRARSEPSCGSTTFASTPTSTRVHIHLDWPTRTRACTKVGCHNGYASKGEWHTTIRWHRLVQPSPARTRTYAESHCSAGSPMSDRSPTCRVLCLSVSSACSNDSGVAHVVASVECKLAPADWSLRLGGT